MRWGHGLKTGTREGITAIQMDIKVAADRESLEGSPGAREGRLFILDKMEAVISEPRQEVSKYAPRITTIKINSDKIRDIIGPGGKMIRKITEETKTTIDIQDDGSVNIGSNNAENTQKAVDWIRSLTREVEAGEIYTGKVTRVLPFGVRRDVPRKEGLCTSRSSRTIACRGRRRRPIGDEIQVPVTETDRQPGQPVAAGAARRRERRGADARQRRRRWWRDPATVHQRPAVTGGGARGRRGFSRDGDHGRAEGRHRRAFPRAGPERERPPSRGRERLSRGSATAGAARAKRGGRRYARAWARRPRPVCRTPER
jgi:hypothetical protein